MANKNKALSSFDVEAEIYLARIGTREETQPPPGVAVWEPVRDIEVMLGKYQPSSFKAPQGSIFNPGPSKGVEPRELVDVGDSAKREKSG